MKILIVEDEGYTQEEIMDSVSAYGKNLEIFSAQNALEAIEIAKTNLIDVALLDIELHGMNGFELATVLYQYNAKMAIAFITAYNHYASEAFEVYAVDYILKPIRTERLHKCLDRLIESTKHVHVHTPSLSIHTFGKFEVNISGEIVKWKRLKASEVLAFLVMHHNQPIHKDKLIETLFYELSKSKATVQLHTIISHIRKVGVPVEYFNNCYRINILPDELDLIRFETALKHFKEEKSGDLEAIKRLYKGQFLEEEGYLWAMAQRSYLHSQYTRLLRMHKN